MLNYIWLSLIVIGIVVAVGYDMRDLSKNPYRNGEAIAIGLEFGEDDKARDERQGCTILINTAMLSKFYGLSETGATNAEERLPATLTHVGKDQGRLLIDVRQSSFGRWKEMAKLQGGDGHVLQGKVQLGDVRGRIASAMFRTDPIRFVTISKVSSEGLFRYAKTAVELAIGLVGIMALWLGVMRIAERSGMIGKLAALLKPATTRLFPDVPPDHPAMGAMIMNISANILGLANAATPLGLKAMEELNKLNKKVGTATDAMCTFLVINTSNVQLIPATVIAIRAASGSGNPTEIIGPAIVATTISTVVGVIVVRWLAKWKRYRNQLLPEG